MDVLPERALNVLHAAHRSSVESYVAVVDDEPLVAFGVITSKLLAREGVVWALASKSSERPGLFRVWVEDAVEIFNMMAVDWNSLDCTLLNENRRALRWLALCDFEVSDPIADVYGRLWRNARWEKK